MSSILAVFAAISESMKAFQVFMANANAFMDWYKKMKADQWTADLHATIEELKNAKTPEEKLNAAKKLQDAIAGL
jgi:hypothetical protein